MEKIKSFQVDHRKLEKGIYISRIDGDIITYDLRFCKPNMGVLLSNAELHSTEHMLATFLRNSKIKDNVIYFGPMGCQTGFYLLVRDAVTPSEVLCEIKNVLQLTLDYSGKMFGASEIECGNYINLDVDMAKCVCKAYLDVLCQINEIIDYDTVNER